MWSLDNESQIPYFGPESRSRIQAIAKNGEVKGNPSSSLRAMHSDAFMKKVGYDLLIIPIESLSLSLLLT